MEFVPTAFDHRLDSGNFTGEHDPSCLRDGDILLPAYVLLSSPKSEMAELKPYLTREERLWPAVGAVALSLFAAATLIVLLAALSCHKVQWASDLWLWKQLGLKDREVRRPCLSSFASWHFCLALIP